MILFTGGEYLGRYPLGPGRPPLGPGTLPPGPGTPPWGPGTPPRTRYTPPGPGTHPRDQVHPPGPSTPPGLGPPPSSSACWEIRAISGRYASYWNAFLCCCCCWFWFFVRGTKYNVLRQEIHKNWNFFTVRNCGKVMFLHLSVILFTGGGVRGRGVVHGSRGVCGRSMLKVQKLHDQSALSRK